MMFDHLPHHHYLEHLLPSSDQHQQDLQERNARQRGAQGWMEPGRLLQLPHHPHSSWADQLPSSVLPCLAAAPVITQACADDVAASAAAAASSRSLATLRASVCRTSSSSSPSSMNALPDRALISWGSSGASVAMAVSFFPPFRIAPWGLPPALARWPLAAGRAHLACSGFADLLFLAAASAPRCPACFLASSQQLWRGLSLVARGALLEPVLRR